MLMFPSQSRFRSTRDPLCIELSLAHIFISISFQMTQATPLEYTLFFPSFFGMDAYMINRITEYSIDNTKPKYPIMGNIHKIVSIASGKTATESDQQHKYNVPNARISCRHTNIDHGCSTLKSASHILSNVSIPC